jgi:hypothetical protein
MDSEIFWGWYLYVDRNHRNNEVVSRIIPKSQAGLAIVCSQIDRLLRRRCLRNYVLCH